MAMLEMQVIQCAVNQQQETELMETVKEHDRLLRGDGETEGVVHSVRALMEDRKERKALQRTILVGVVALIAERVINYIGLAVHNL